MIKGLWYQFLDFSGPTILGSFLFQVGGVQRKTAWDPKQSERGSLCVVLTFLWFTGLPDLSVLQITVSVLCACRGVRWEYFMHTEALCLFTQKSKTSVACGHAVRTSLTKTIAGAWGSEPRLSWGGFHRVTTHPCCLHTKDSQLPEKPALQLQMRPDKSFSGEAQ